MDTSLHKTGNKKIVECASDCLWGTGQPLGDPTCFDSSKWVSQGILGQILESIRDEVITSRVQSHTFPPPPTLFSEHQPVGSAVPIHQTTSHLSPSELNHISGITSSTEIQEEDLSTGSFVTSDPIPIPSAAHQDGSCETTPMESWKCKCQHLYYTSIRYHCFRH